MAGGRTAFVQEQTHLLGAATEAQLEDDREDAPAASSASAMASSPAA